MKILSIFILLSSTLFSCQQQEKSVSTDIETKAVSNDELVVYTPSELATLMLDMYDENMQWKTAIMNGEVPSLIPEEYKTIHSAQSINNGTETEFFDNMADSFLQSITTVTNSIPETAKGNFNAMVNVCISCHTEICHGPIPKIKKLLIH